MPALHPNTQPEAFLPARLRHSRDQSCGGELAKREARNLETANKCPAAPGYFTAVNHPGWAGITRKLGQTQVILFRFQLSAERRVFLNGRALAFVAIFPGCFCHNGTRKVARKPSHARVFCDGRKPVPRRDLLLPVPDCVGVGVGNLERVPPKNRRFRGLESNALLPVQPTEEPEPDEQE